MDGYDAIQAMRWSTLGAAVTSAKHLQERIASPREDTTTFRFGRAYHVAVLQPVLYDRSRIIAPASVLTESGTLSTGKKATEWLAEQPTEDLPVVTPEENERCLRIRDAVSAHEDGRTWLDHATDVELPIVWQDEANGIAVQAKGRIDALCRKIGLLWDLKGTSSRGGPISVESVRRAVATYNYHGQNAWYARGLAKQPEPIIVDALGWVFVEVEAPHDVVVVQASDRMVKRGWDLAELALGRYATAQSTGVWPGCAPKMQVIDLPYWADKDGE